MMYLLQVEVVAYDESITGFDRFYKGTEMFWLVLYLIVLLVRLGLNFYIHAKTDSPSYRGPDSDAQQLGDMIPKSYNERSRERDHGYRGTPGMRDSESIEFLLICFFSLWWWKNRLDDPKTALLKKRANLLNLIFVLFTTLVILMYFRLK